MNAAVEVELKSTDSLEPETVPSHIRFFCLSEPSGEPMMLSRQQKPAVFRIPCGQEDGQKIYTQLVTALEKTNLPLEIPFDDHSAPPFLASAVGAAEDGVYLIGLVQESKVA